MEIEQNDSPSITSAVWENYYGPGPFSDNMGRIVTAVSACTTVDREIVEGIVTNAIMRDPEAFDSLNPGAALIIADLLQKGVPVYLWTIGVQEIQEGKLKAINQHVRSELIARVGEYEAQRIAEENLHESISSGSKTQEFEIIARGLLGQNRRQIYIADDKHANISSAKEIASHMGIQLTDFVVNRNHPDGSFTACIRHLRNWLGSDTSGNAVVFDVDDTLFDETGPNGRLSKLPEIISRNLEKITTTK